MDSEKVRNIARFQHKCYLPGGNTVSFSDGQSEDHYRLGLTCYLARNIEGVVIPDISAAMEFEMDHCYRFMGNLQDDIWVQEYLEAEDEKREEGEEWFTLLPQAQWAVWKKGRTGIAFKGGNNDEPHNHNDIGSFLLTVEGEVFLTDLGCGEYTKEYFLQKIHEHDYILQRLCDMIFCVTDLMDITFRSSMAVSNLQEADFTVNTSEVIVKDVWNYPLQVRMNPVQTGS